LLFGQEFSAPVSGFMKGALQMDVRPQGSKGAMAGKQSKSKVGKTSGASVPRFRSSDTLFP